jgi:poly(3-hydroxybutyrate) depolymerase
LALNIERHVKAYFDFFDHLVTDNKEAAERHRLFYDEYLSVMDIPAEFFLETVEKVFINHDLPKGSFKWKDHTVDLKKIRQTALFTIEGESDNISPKGQTEIAQHLCSSLPSHLRRHYLQEGVGHYGLFNGHRWRENIMPEIRNFIYNIEKSLPSIQH